MIPDKMPPSQQSNHFQSFGNRNWFSVFQTLQENRHQDDPEHLDKFLDHYRSIQYPDLAYNAF